MADLLLVLSVAAMFVASAAAIWQDNLKHMLAYSSLGQIGYITFGIGLATPTGLTGSIVHLFNHGITKGALFMLAGCIALRLGSVRFDRHGRHRQDDALDLRRHRGRRLEPHRRAGDGGIRQQVVPGARGRRNAALVDRDSAGGKLAARGGLRVAIRRDRLVPRTVRRRPVAARGAAAMLVPAWVLVVRCRLVRRGQRLARRGRVARRRGAARGHAMSAETAILAALVVPLLGALLIVAAHRAPNVREAVTLATASLLFVTVLSLLPAVLAGARPALRVVELLPDIPLAFEVEPLGMLFALVASGLWIVNSVYSIGYMRGNDEAHQTRFYACFALALAATIAVAFAANLLTLFLAYELLTLVTYPLVTHHGTPEAMRAGRVYLGVLLGTSILLLFVAMVATWHIAGTLDFRVGGILDGRIGNAALGGLLAAYMFGIGKAALMPVHRWLPAAMVAPTPVSALLHAVAVVKAGVFSVVKVIVYVFGVETLAGLTSVDWLPTVAGFTIVAASIVALRADNLKRRLAYSTVSQLSYVVLAASLLVPLSIVGAALHIAAHAVAKITLFFAAGAIYTAAHKTEVSELDGIGRRMPWTMGAFAVGAHQHDRPAADGGLRQQVVHPVRRDGRGPLGCGRRDRREHAAQCRLLPADRLPRRSSAPETGAHGEAPLPMVAALVITAALTVLMFFFADVPLALARQLVRS